MMKFSLRENKEDLPDELLHRTSLEKGEAAQVIGGSQHFGLIQSLVEDAD